MHLHEMVEVEKDSFWGAFAKRQHRIGGVVVFSVGLAVACTVWALFYNLRTFATQDGADAAFLIPTIVISLLSAAFLAFLCLSDPPEMFTVHTMACTKCNKLVDNVAIYRQKEKDWKAAITAKEDRAKATIQRYATRNLKPPANTKKA